MEFATVADLVEIQALLGEYAAAIDDKDYDLLDAVFTPDARLIYDLNDGKRVEGTYAEMKGWVRETLASFPVTEHLMGLPQIRLSGDTARARTMLFNPMLLGQPDGGTHLFFVGGVYRDRLVRTPAGWRIAERHETGTWDQFAPTDEWAAPDLGVPA